jgi:hypothetical protein
MSKPFHLLLTLPTSKADTLRDDEIVMFVLTTWPLRASSRLQDNSLTCGRETIWKPGRRNKTVIPNRRCEESAFRPTCSANLCANVKVQSSTQSAPSECAAGSPPVRKSYPHEYPLSPRKSLPRGAPAGSASQSRPALLVSPAPN